MNEIQEWLKDKNRDYDKGVRLYMNSDSCKSRTLQSLKRGKNQRNFSLLLSELRKLKNKNLRADKVSPKPKTTRKIVQKAQETSKPSKATDEFTKKSQINRSTQNEFKKVRMGDLPKELRPRFKRLSDIFYEMCELKFSMNDAPADQNTLDLQLAIEALDEEKDLIWKEIDHWTKFKTLLPVATEDDYSELSPQKMYLKKANLQSNITKVKKRIQKQKEAYEIETIPDEKVKIKTALNKSLKTLHKNELNLIKIEELLS